MMLGLGVGGVAVGIFHLFTHAYFKSLLFMGSGSVNHATGTFDMRLMGGLKKHMRWTYWTFVIGSLSLAGIWPLAGFWSKDGILLSAYHGPAILFWFALITVFLTAFYMFRAIFLTFHGEYKGGAPGEHGGHADFGHPHESPLVMTFPLVFLAGLAIVAGWFNVTGGFAGFLGGGEGGHGESVGFLAGLFEPFAHMFHPLPESLPVMSLLVGLLGIFAAYAIYLKKWLSAERIGGLFQPLYTLLYRKYFFDELYENIIVKLVLMKGLFAGFQQFDAGGVDGLVNGVASGIRASGRAIRRAQTGQLQLYGLFIGIGILAIILSIFIFG
ncbi:MAG: proton-conducting transporter membrane subunit, partial [Chloroflexota bacterium]